MSYIVKKYNRQIVEQAYKTLTLKEFETQFSITPDMAQAFKMQGEPQPA